MEQEIEIIGIDHGWSQIKTAAHVFTTAVEEAHSPTFYDNIVEYKGKHKRNDHPSPNMF